MTIYHSDGADALACAVSRRNYLGDAPMRSFRLVPIAAVALLAVSSMAQAAPVHYRHHTISSQYSGAAGPFGVPITAPYPSSELWPPCMQGPPTCTAAGYPNLHYLREIQGGQ
jgi:hypothetical protein